MSHDHSIIETTPMNDLELKAGLKVTWTGVWTNVVLVILKLTIGFWGKSQALVADGVHSTSDLFSDAVVLLGLRYGRKEADQQHPYGHGKIETLASLIVGVILVVIGIGVAVHAIDTILHAETMHPSAWAIWVAALSIVTKELLYWYTVKVGRRIRSTMLIANAWHHRTDALSSVAVLIGIAFAWAKPEWRIADSLAALVVAYPIIRVGIRFSYDALKELIDTVPGEAIIRRIEKIASETSGVITVHDITARRSGPDMMMELHLVVDPHQTVFEGHRIAKAVEKRLLDEIEGALRVTIHVDPDTDQDRQPSL